LPLAARRRYTPAYRADVQDFLAQLERHGAGGGVLVQPSFLGTDNSHLIASLAAAPERLRGIAVVSPNIGDEELAAHDAAGIVGIRLNLIGEEPEAFLTAPWRRLVYRVGRLGWQVEIQAEGRDVPMVLDALGSADAPLVIDHFGRPDAALGCNDPGFRRLLQAGPHGGVWVKLSAPYRCGKADADSYALALLDRLGPGRLLWGSDWPFTQFETQRSYADAVDDLEHWCDSDTRDAIAETARLLFGFAASETLTAEAARQARG
jgi:predicted TIM-barrel fold metal-dependent hydrolase